MGYPRRYLYTPERGQRCEGGGGGGGGEGGGSPEGGEAGAQLPRDRELPAEPLERVVQGQEAQGLRRQEAETLTKWRETDFLCIRHHMLIRSCASRLRTNADLRIREKRIHRIPYQERS